MKKVLLAAVQMRTTNNKLTNLRRTYDFIREIVAERDKRTDFIQDANNTTKHTPTVENSQSMDIFICLPECCAFMGANGDETITAAESIDPNPESVLNFPHAKCKVNFRRDSADQIESHKGDITNFTKGYDGIGDINYTAGLCEMASQFKVWISVGGFPEKRLEDATKISNTHFIISPEGKIASSLYRKIHLFDAPVVGLCESKSTVPGNEIVTASVANWNVALTICYDIRFPELYQSMRFTGTGAVEAMHRPPPPPGPVIEAEAAATRILNPSTTTIATTTTTTTTSPSASKYTEKESSPAATAAVAPAPGGIDMILVPSAFACKTGAAHWEVLLRARAIETQCYVVAAAQSGKHNDKRTSYGHSMIIDPWGSIIAHLDDSQPGEGVCYAVADKTDVLSIRQSMPIQDHKRPDLFKPRFRAAI